MARNKINLKQLAQKENWALYVLIGFRGTIRAVIKPILSQGIFLSLDSAIATTINHIKYKQWERMKLKGKAPK